MLATSDSSRQTVSIDTVNDSNEIRFSILKAASLVPNEAAFLCAIID